MKENMTIQSNTFGKDLIMYRIYVFKLAEDSEYFAKNIFKIIRIKLVLFS